MVSWDLMSTNDKGPPLGTPNREPPEYNGNITEHKDPGRYIPTIFLLYYWGSLFGVPNKVPLNNWTYSPPYNPLTRLITGNIKNV